MRYIQRCKIAGTLALAFVLVAPAFAQAPPLSGSVVQPNGDTLSQAKVELLAQGSERVVGHAYTDDRGLFAFRKVEEGVYDLRIRFGEQILPQETDKGAADRRQVRLNGTPKRLIIRLA